MRKLLIAIALLPVSLLAQVGPTAITLGTNNVPVNSTNSAASDSVNIVGQKNVSLFISGASGSSTNTTTSILGVEVSADNVTYYNAGVRYRIPLLMSGTSTVTTYTNIDTSGFQYFRIKPIENVAASGATNYLTNLAVSYFYK